MRDHKPATDESPAPVSTEPEIAPEVRRNLPRSSVPAERSRNGNGTSAEKPRNGATTEEDEELFAEPSFRAARRRAGFAPPRRQ